MSNGVGDNYREIIMGCCRPIYWFRLDGDPMIVDSGTINFIQTPSNLIGVTAAHVFNGYIYAKSKHQIRAQISNFIVEDLESRLIAIDHKLDVATFDLSGIDLAEVGSGVSPLQSWPPQPPDEGFGIMIGGYPGKDRIHESHLDISWGLFTALGVARVVSNDQITWIAPRGAYVIGEQPPPNQDLGGISGGPLIAVFESPGGLLSFRLAGVISEAQATLEYVIARRLDGLRPNGTLQEFW
jgi:hypothetical protein